MSQEWQSQNQLKYRIGFAFLEKSCFSKPVPQKESNENANNKSKYY